MNRLILALLIIGISQVVFADVFLNGYLKRDGTYIKPHYRSNTNSNFYDNWSTKPNINPYTGKRGTKVTPPQHNQNNYNPRRLNFQKWNSF